MGFFRFRRSFRLMPGMRLNLGKRSTSVSLGVRGAHVTLGGPQGTRTTVGLPGTGLSYTEIAKPHQDEEAPMQASAQSHRSLVLPLLILAAMIIAGARWAGWL